MTDRQATQSGAASILITDGDIVSRHAIADFLRRCGYGVVEAATTDEAMTALGEPTLSIDIILCDVSTLGSKSGFELANWVRERRPELEARLAAGVEPAAQAAADLCESGPNLKRPTTPRQSWITSNGCEPVASASSDQFSPANTSDRIQDQNHHQPTAV